MWILLGAFFTLLIGLRYQVGGDWGSYLMHYYSAINEPIEVVFLQKDPGYAMLNWLSSRVGGGIYLVNTVCGAVVMAGMIVFARRQPQPLLAFVVAVPYMIVVVAMGYTRQSVAMGFELLALVFLVAGRFRLFVGLVICGALFHKSAVVLLPFAALASTKKRAWTWTWVGAVTVVTFSLILMEHYERLWQLYVERGRVSEGGGIRVAMNALPAVLFLSFRDKMALNQYEKKLWAWIAIFSLACVPLVFFASTAVDRVALYFMPIQMLVFSRVERLINDEFFRPLARWGVVLGYGLVLWVWLNYASHAFAWLPYRFAPFV